MKKLITIWCALCLIAPVTLLSQEKKGGGAVPLEMKGENKNETPAGEDKHGADNGAADAEKKGNKAKNFNIDAMMLYGQYNTLQWAGSILQNFDSFTYQLNSDFRRSNDFGYKNSRFYENEVGFTGDADITKKWKMTPELEVNNESHGMFRNPFYYREEKDRVALKIKNEFKPMPTRWELNLGGVYFTHRLDASLYQDISLIRTYHSSDFYKAGAEFAWEYIWSAANKLRFDSKFSQYFYSTGADNDTAVRNELLWNFNFSEYFKFAVGPLYAYNRDGGHFVSGTIDIATANLKYVTIDAAYVYDLIPFTPEDYYFDQKYVMPYYSLHPGREHKAELNFGVAYSATGSEKVYVKKVKFKATGSYSANDRYYSYFSLSEMVLAPHQMKVTRCRARGEFILGVGIYDASLELGGKYEYSYFYASDYVTYQPEHQGSAYIKLALYRFEGEFSTSYRDTIQTSPFMKLTLRKVINGNLSLQLRVFESFYLFGRVNNIYNSKYSMVFGYPEQGRTIIGGLRIII